MMVCYKKDRMNHNVDHNKSPMESTSTIDVKLKVVINNDPESPRQQMDRGDEHDKRLIASTQQQGSKRNHGNHGHGNDHQIT